MKLWSAQRSYMTPYMKVSVKPESITNDREYEPPVITSINKETEESNE